jgi:hypothetical protein
LNLVALRAVRLRIIDAGHGHGLRGFQSSVVKTRLAGLTLPSAVLLLVMGTVTLAEGLDGERDRERERRGAGLFASHARPFR